MNRNLNYILFLLIVLHFFDGRAQEAANPTEKNKNGSFSDDYDKVTRYTKLTSGQGEQKNVLFNNPDNPVLPVSDSKLNEAEAGSTISKPPFDQLIDTKIATTTIFLFPTEDPAINTTECAVKPSSEINNTQPEAFTLEKSTNNRLIAGPDTQPVTTQPLVVTNYRQLNEANTQPAGDKPNP